MNSNYCIKKYQIRPWHYISCSNVDFIDFWLSLLFIVLGIHFILADPVDKIWYYEPMLKYGISSNLLSVLLLSLGSVNLIKIFNSTKPNLVFDLTIKLIMLCILISLSFATMKQSVFHVVSLFYSMSAFLSFVTISKTK